MSSNRRLLSNVRIDAPLEVVWAALTVPAQIQQWFGWEYEGLEAEVQQYFVDGVTVDAAEHALIWSHGDEARLQSDGTGTRVVWLRPTADVDPMPDQAEDIDEGWVAFIEQLRFWLDHHRGEKRATIYLSGAARQEFTFVSDALGLHVDAAVGERYACASVVGDRLEGAVWARQGNVTGITADSCGNGLIVLVDHDSKRHAPNGGGTVTITTYGLPDEEFERLRREWVAAWEARYRRPPSSEPRHQPD